MRRQGWDFQTASALVSDEGVVFDLRGLGSQQVKREDCKGAARASDGIALASTGRSLLQASSLESDGHAALDMLAFWPPLQKLPPKSTALWTQRHWAGLRALISNLHWTQARLHAHGLAASPMCTLCRGGAGTLYHRKYLRAAHARFRRERTTRRMRERAARVHA